MIVKAILVFCTQALLAQSVLSYCTGSPLSPSLGLAAPALAYGGLPGPFVNDGRLGWAGRDLIYDGVYTAGVPALDFSPTSGGGFPVSSASARGPIVIAVDSENNYEGILAATGELPFIGTVGFEGVLPTAGAGAVNHACGNGINAMASEPAAFAAPGLGYCGPATGLW